MNTVGARQIELDSWNLRHTFSESHRRRCRNARCVGAAPGGRRLADKTIRATRPNGEPLDTVIGSTERNAGELILHGVEAGRGWSMAITEATGRMVLTASEDEVAFVVFGVCNGLNG